jgi:putative DNA primase/helicase
MHRDPVEFAPSHTAFLVTNHLPKVSGDDPAVWRRLRVIPFDVVIPPADRNPHLDEALQAEADAVLGRAIAGWNAHRGKGEQLAEPPQVKVATDDYQRDSDALARFIDEECVTSSPAQNHHA